MPKLAVLGGEPVFERSLDWRGLWPPVDEKTARALQEHYVSRKWTAFDEVELDFARAFAAHHDARHGIFTINGTATLHCALAALGIGRGDEVIVPPLTWYSTALAVRYVGATPVFVDIEPDTLCIDPRAIEAAITARTRAVIPVHSYGSMADMERIMEVARRHDLSVIEDCAHMHGGAWRGRGVGSIGSVGSFSFQTSKTMASGEGGICITNDAGLAERIFRIKQIGYGQGDRPGQARHAPPPGLLCYNFRATAFHPVILREQLETLGARVARYEQAVRALEQRLRVSTRIRFQSRGREATRQGYFGWFMIFDDPAFAGIPIGTIQQACAAEGLPLGRAEGPMYRTLLFNLRPDEYRVAMPCRQTEHVCERGLWMLHPFLGLDHGHLDRIAAVLEKVAVHVHELRARSACN